MFALIGMLFAIMNSLSNLLTTFFTNRLLIVGSPYGWGMGAQQSSGRMACLDYCRFRCESQSVWAIRSADIFHMGTAEYRRVSQILQPGILHSALLSFLRSFPCAPLANRWRNYFLHVMQYHPRPLRKTLCPGCSHLADKSDF